MIVAFVLLALLGCLLILPGWFWFRRQRPQSPWLLALPAVGILLWLVLAVVGVGPQSFTNIIEAPGVAVMAVATSYMKFIVFDRSPSLNARGTAIAMIVVVLVTLGFRLLMPSLPE